MSIQLSASSFLQMLSQSGLLTEEQLRGVEQRFADSASHVSATEICQWLLEQELITEWHAEKLLNARFRGFFLGPYKLLSRVARGGMSTIYSARHVASGEIHALKVLPLARINQASYLLRFQREAAITQRLQHPNIIRVFGVYSESDGQDLVHFMAMELLQGRDLFEIVNSDGPLSCRMVAEYIRQAASGLQYAHEAGLVHRDIKPGNLFLTDEGSIRILDLGLAQDFDSGENLTRDFNERVLGTADYLAPEQAADSHTVDNRADIYSLGCTMYFLLTGQPPFTEGTLVQRLMAHQTRSPPPMSRFRKDVPETLISILGDMMMKNRKHRISSAADVVSRLSQFLTPVLTLPRQEPAELVDVVDAHWIAMDEPVSSLLPVSSEDVDEDETEDPAAHQDLLPAFNDLLRSIEMACQPGGKLAADLRSAELLQFVQNLMDRTDGKLQTHVVNTVPSRLSLSRDFSITWIEGVAFLLAVIAFIAAMLNWTRF
jgi:serine/threonine protein kinase